jgi:hypothetical protein
MSSSFHLNNPSISPHTILVEGYIIVCSYESAETSQKKTQESEERIDERLTAGYRNVPIQQCLRQRSSPHPRTLYIPQHRAVMERCGFDPSAR